MTKFQYTAISQQGKSLNGIIDADTKENARNKLYQLKLTVVSLEQVSKEDSNQKDYLKYKFEAFDKNSKKVIGTIASSSLLSAFEKLSKEYDLEVKKLASTTATEAEFEISSLKIQQFTSQLNTLQENKTNDTSNLEFQKNKQKEEFQKVIEEIISTIRLINSKYSSQLKPEAIDFLNKYEIHLNKIKFSENTENIIQAALKVLNHIQTSEIFLSNSENYEEQLDLQLDILRLNKIVSSHSTQHNELIQTFSNTLAKIGLKLNTNLKSKFNKLTGYLEIVFKTKSRKIRQEALIKFFKEIGRKFSSTKETKAAGIFTENNYKVNKTESELLSLTSWLLSVFLAFYFISVFITEKNAKFQLNKLFFIYNTKFLIYIITATILIHSAIKVNILLKTKKFQNKSLTYPIFLLLYLMIIINL
jgi:hypothetical protein